MYSGSCGLAGGFGLSGGTGEGSTGEGTPLGFLQQETTSVERQNPIMKPPRARVRTGSISHHVRPVHAMLYLSQHQAFCVSVQALRSFMVPMQTKRFCPQPFLESAWFTACSSL